MNYTFTNEQDGQPYTQYYWADWTSATTPSTLYFYNDQTYTTVPGDLGTAGSSYVAISNGTGSYIGYGKTWRFWASDAEPNSLLVTRGLKPIFYWPGLTSAFVFRDSAWAGEANDATCLFPWTHTYGFQAKHAPIYGSGASAMYLHPAMGAPNVTGVDLGGMYQGFEMMYSNNANQLDSYAGRAFSITQSDVLLLLPNVPTTTRNLLGAPTSSNLAYKIGTNYYLASNSSRSGNNLMFDFGTSEPDLS